MLVASSSYPIGLTNILLPDFNNVGHARVDVRTYGGWLNRRSRTLKVANKSPQWKINATGKHKYCVKVHDVRHLIHSIYRVNIHSCVWFKPTLMVPPRQASDTMAQPIVVGHIMLYEPGPEKGSWDDILERWFKSDLTFLTFSTSARLRFRRLVLCPKASILSPVATVFFSAVKTALWKTARVDIPSASSGLSEKPGVKIPMLR